VKQAELEEAIVRAAERGDDEELSELQARYRMGVAVTRITNEPISLVERSAGRSTPVSNGNSNTVGHNLPLAVRLTSGAVRELNELPFDNEERREAGGWMFGTVTRTEVVVHAIRGPAGTPARLVSVTTCG